MRRYAICDWIKKKRACKEDVTTSYFYGRVNFPGNAAYRQCVNGHLQLRNWLCFSTRWCGVIKPYSLFVSQVLNLFLALLLNAFARESLQDEAEKRGEKQPSKFYQGVQRLSRVLRLNSMIPRRTQVKPTQPSADDRPESVKNSDDKGDFV